MATISTSDYLLDQAKRRITPTPVSPSPGWVALEKRLAGPRLEPARVGRAPSGQRPQTRDGR